jgi:hypothetical protein
MLDVQRLWCVMSNACVDIALRSRDSSYRMSYSLHDWFIVIMRPAVTSNCCLMRTAFSSPQPLSKERYAHCISPLSSSVRYYKDFRYLFTLIPVFICRGNAFRKTIVIFTVINVILPFWVCVWLMRVTPNSSVVPHSDLLIQNWVPNQACVRYKHNVLLVPCDRILYNVPCLCCSYAPCLWSALVAIIEVRSAIYLFLSEYLGTDLNDTEGRLV